MKNNLRWAYKTLVLSISLSIIFSLLSQSILPTLGVFLSIFVIFFFITISVVFDMISLAFTTVTKERLEVFEKEKGYKTAMHLCDNSEKVCSFCGDVVGDICGILSGAGGVSLVVNMNIQNVSLNLIITCLVSSLIAGLTIFGKAVMKGYAMENCEKLALLTSKYLETAPWKWFKRKKFKRNKKNIKK